MLLDMRRALRCHAMSKRSGKRCRSPAVKGYEVCRMHGAVGGAPKGNSNALKHGASSAEMLALKKEVQALARLARETMAAIGVGRCGTARFAEARPIVPLRVAIGSEPTSAETGSRKVLS